MINKRVVFSTFVSGNADIFCARALIDSLRAFGGSLSQSPFWIFGTHHDPRFTPGNNIEFFLLPESNHETQYYFPGKVRSWAMAEDCAKDNFDTLIWIDPACLILNPPESFILEKDFLAAFRPVHIRNVGQLFGQQPDEFWRAIFLQCETAKSFFSVKSYVDGQEIYPYFNTHCFSVSPKLGVLKKTLNNLTILDSDQEFMRTSCSDDLHKIFLFQAVLAATVLKEILEPQIRLLPPDYSYPLHLVDKITDEKKIKDIEGLTVLVYEERKIAENSLSQLDIPFNKRQWLDDYFIIR